MHAPRARPRVNRHARLTRRAPILIVDLDGLRSAPELVVALQGDRGGVTSRHHGAWTPSNRRVQPCQGAATTRERLVLRNSSLIVKAGRNQATIRSRTQTLQTIACRRDGHLRSDLQSSIRGDGDEGSRRTRVRYVQHAGCCAEGVPKAVHVREVDEGDIRRRRTIAARRAGLRKDGRRGRGRRCLRACDTNEAHKQKSEK